MYHFGYKYPERRKRAHDQNLDFGWSGILKFKSIVMSFF